MCLFHCYPYQHGTQSEQASCRPFQPCTIETEQAYYKCNWGETENTGKATTKGIKYIKKPYSKFTEPAFIFQASCRFEK